MLIEFDPLLEQTSYLLEHRLQIWPFLIECRINAKFTECSIIANSTANPKNSTPKVTIWDSLNSKVRDGPRSLAGDLGSSRTLRNLRSGDFGDLDSSRTLLKFVFPLASGVTFDSWRSWVSSRGFSNYLLLDRVRIVNSEIVTSKKEVKTQT